MSIDLSATGAASYTWASPGTFTIGQSVTASPNVTTTYTVTGINGNGCLSQTTVVQFVSECTDLKENNNTVNNLSVHPNPNNGVFTVRLSGSEVKTFDVLDISGKIVLTHSTTDIRAEFDIHDLANGIYYLRVRSNNEVHFAKIVKQ